MPDEKIQPQEIVFPNNNGAKLVSVSRGTPMAGLIESLGISLPKNLILVIGGADKLDEKLTSRLTQLFSRGIARAAADAEALISTNIVVAHHLPDVNSAAFG
jgi:urocanate hydratase